MARDAAELQEPLRPARRRVGRERFGRQRRTEARQVGRQITERLVAERKHPVAGEAALMPLAELKEAARIVRAHHERYDGRGYPDGLQGEAIPLGARVLSVVNDYDGLQIGTLTEKRLGAEDVDHAFALLVPVGQRRRGVGTRAA